MEIGNGFENHYHKKTLSYSFLMIIPNLYAGKDSK